MLLVTGIVGSVVLLDGSRRRQTVTLKPSLDVHAPLSNYGNSGVNMFCWFYSAEKIENRKTVV